MNFSDPNLLQVPSLPIINPELPRGARGKVRLPVLPGDRGAGGPGDARGLVWLSGVVVTRRLGQDLRAERCPRTRSAADSGRLPPWPRRPVEQRQLWDLSLRRGLPELARAILAEGIGDDLVAEDPQGYVTAVARSPDWPDWLRLALARPMAYAATRGHAISRERLGELCRLNDPVLRLWALYTLAVQPRPDPQTVVEIERVATSSAGA